MNRTDCSECGGVLELGFVADHGDYSKIEVPYWVAGEPEQTRFLGLSAGIATKGRPRYDVVTYRCRVCGLLKSYAPRERAR